MLKSYSNLMLIIYLSFGLIIGIIFPVFVSPFIDIREGYVWIFSIACIAAGLLLGGLNYVIFIVFSKSITDRLRDVFSHVREGDFESRTHMKSHDMFGELAKDIDYTLSCLAESERKSMHDELTGLPNRVYLQTEFQKLKEEACLIYIDLNGFKSINDKYGHSAGDKILVKMAALVRKQLTDSETFIRIGGDEFVILKKRYLARQHIEETIETVFDCFKRLSIESDYYINIIPSIGVSCYPSDSNQLNELLSKADDAMYRVKHKRVEGTFCFYSDSSETADSF